MIFKWSNAHHKENSVCGHFLFLQIEKLNNLQKEIKDIEDNLAQAKKGTCTRYFLLFFLLSPAHLSITDHLLSIVCISLYPSVCKIFTFSSSSLEPWANVIQTWHKASIGEGFKFLQMEGYPLFQGEIIAKILWHHLKVFFSRTIGPIST